MAKKQVGKRNSVGRRKKSKKQKRATKRYILSAAFLFCIAFGVFLLYKGFSFGDDLGQSDKYFVKGIDVSHHNPIMNWNTVLEQGVSFAYLKATEGNTLEDRNYPYNYERAKGLNIRIGSYHFYTFALSGKEQAQHFIRVAGNQSGDLLPAIDVEHSPANPYSTDTAYVALVIKELKVLENELHEYFGMHPVIYTNRNCYDLYIKDRFPHNFIWMSDLKGEPSNEINWKIWQYTHSGSLPGVVGDIDFNYYRHSFDQFKELLLP